MQPLQIRMLHKKDFILSILLSLVLHLLSIHFASRYSIWFASPVAPPQSISSLEKLDRNQILKESFVQSKSVPHTSDRKPFHEKNSFFLKTFISVDPSFDLSLLSTPTIETFSFHNQLLASNSSISFTIPEFERLNLFEHLPKDLIVPAPPLFTYPLPIPTQITEGPLVSKNPAPQAMEEPPSPSVAYETPLLAPSLREDSSYPKAPLFTPTPQLPNFPSLAALETASYSDWFDTDLIFLPREDQEGYIFALTLIPRPGLHLPKIKQNYSFLIDRSNSIQKERLLAAKTAVYKALDELESDDTFNIIAFDSKVDKLAPSSLPYSTQSVKAAKAFLDKIELGSFFSSANLFKPLFLTIPSEVKEDELHTAIVLTDGECLNKSSTQKSLLYDWTANNRSRVSLFALGIGGDPHLSSLNVATAFNRGMMTYSPTKGSIKRKLLKLMKILSHPVAKNLSCRAIHPHSQMQIEFYPKQAQMPHLYLNEPYVIMGTTDTLDNFILFVQGRLKDKWVHIKKKVSFTAAKKGDISLKMEWALQQSYTLYEQYIYDENPKHLSEARHLLQPYNLRVAFE